MKILVGGAIDKDSEIFEAISKLGHETVYVSDERIALKEQGVDVSEFDGVICNSIFLYNDIKEFSSLKYIQLTSAGFDRVPMDYIKENNIRIFNARGVYSIPMAEFGVMGVMQLYKNSRKFYLNQINHIWEKNRTSLELYNKTVCIVGCGNVGTECAKRFSAFGTSVIGVDLFEVKNSIYNEMYPLCDIDVALSKSDIVVLTLPLTKESKGLINSERFEKMKSGAVLVNIARGGVVETDALISALKNKLMGAVLDVFESEPLSEESPLWDMQNVVLTPHNSFVGDGNKERLCRVILENISSLHL